MERIKHASMINVSRSYTGATFSENTSKIEFDDSIIIGKLPFSLEIYFKQNNTNKWPTSQVLISFSDETSSKIDIHAKDQNKLYLTLTKSTGASIEVDICDNFFSTVDEEIHLVLSFNSQGIMKVFKNRNEIFEYYFDINDNSINEYFSDINRTVNHLGWGPRSNQKFNGDIPVSYTHLTLPTSVSV